MVGLARDDAAALPRFLDTPDQDLRFFIGDLIRRNGRPAAEPLCVVAREGSDDARRSAVHLLGRIAKQLDEGTRDRAVETVLAALTDDDPKVRRNAAIALGDVGGDNAVSALTASIDTEQFDWVRPSMILAIGKVGGLSAAAALERVTAKTQSDTEALEKARDRARQDDAPTPELTALPTARVIELRCAPGLEDVLIDVVAGQAHAEAQRVQTGAVRLRTQDVSFLRSVRPWREWLIPVAERELDAPTEASFDAAGIDLLREGLAAVETFFDAPDAVRRFRIEVRGKETSHQSRRRLVKGWATALAREQPAFENSPSRHQFELRLQRAKRKVALFLKLTDQPGDRFDYRVADVPASMHPATAAGIVRWSGSGVQRPRVLDPFCGSGTLLFERARSGAPVGEIVGSDVSGKAVEAARSNAPGFDSARFVRGDVRSVHHDGLFDELISNLPYGIRTGSHGKNVEAYRALIGRLPEWLNDGASVTLVTQEIALMTALFEETEGLTLRSVRRVDVGGLQPGVFVGVYRKSATEVTEATEGGPA